MPLKLMIGRDAFHHLNLDMETSMVRLLQYNPGQILSLHTDSIMVSKIGLVMEKLLDGL